MLNDLNDELEALTRRTLVEQVRPHPDRTLAELLNLVVSARAVEHFERRLRAPVELIG